MTEFSPLSRRKFLLAASATAAGSILLKGCTGNPPEAGTGSTSSPGANPVASVKPGEEPEVSDNGKTGLYPDRRSGSSDRR